LPRAEPLRPGDLYAATLVFEVPAVTPNAKLLIADREPLWRLSVGHVHSLLHGKIYRALGNAPPSSARTEP
jgi:hypothetical protein